MTESEKKTAKLTIDWNALEGAYEHGADGGEYDGRYPYLHKQTGAIVYVRDGDGGDDLDFDDGEEADGDEQAVDWDNLIRVPRFDSHEESRWIDDFRSSLRNRALIQALDRMPGGRGFFRRFKEILMRHNALDDWHDYRADCVTWALVDWLRGENIEFDLPEGFEEADDNGGQPVEIPVRATIQQVIGGRGVIRLGDFIEGLENSAPDASFEYDITVRVRSQRPLNTKQRAALEKRAFDALIARPKFVDDKSDK